MKKTRLFSRSFQLKVFLIAFLMFGSSGCLTFSIGQRLGKYFESLQQAYLSEEDPELVQMSLPLNMKIVEALILEYPEDEALLTAAAAIFVNYAFGFIYEKGQIVVQDDYEKGSELLKRSLNLMIRSNQYALRAINSKYPDLGQKFQNSPTKEIAEAIEKNSFTKEDVTLLYYTAMSYAGAVMSSDGNPTYLVKFPIIKALLNKAVSIEPSWNNGAIYSALMSTVLANPAKMPNIKRSEALAYFNKANSFSKGTDCSLYLGLAEGLYIPAQEKQKFLELVDKSLKVDIKVNSTNRLSNVLCQRKALWLRKNLDKFFL